MKTRRGTLCCYGTRPVRITRGFPKGGKKKNGTVDSNGTRRKHNKHSSVRVDRRSKVPSNRVHVQFSVANECAEEALFVLRKIVYMQQYDMCMRTHDPWKPVAWFTVAALINVDEWTWDALKCMNLWQRDQAECTFRTCPFSASEDEFLFQYGDTGSDTFWYNLASVFKRDPGVVRDRWHQLSTTENLENVGSHSTIQSFSPHEPNWNNDGSNVDVTDGGSSENVAAAPRALSLPSASPVVSTLCTNSSSQMPNYLKPTLAQSGVTYKPIRKKEEPLEMLEETEKTYEAADDWSSEDVSGGDDTWEGSVCSARSVIFPFSWESVGSVDTPISEAQVW